MAAVVLMHGALLLGLAPGSADPGLPEPTAARPATLQVRAVAAPPREAAQPARGAAPPGAAISNRRPVARQQIGSVTPQPGANTAAAATDAWPMASAAPLIASAAAPPLEAAAAPASPAATSATRPPQSHAAALPPGFEAAFRLRRGALTGRARWRFSPDEARYRLELESSMPGRDLGHLRSEGWVAADGLRPLRFVEGRRGRDQRAVNFQRESTGGGRITFSGPGTELAMPDGVQDRLSWLLQLAAVLEATPALREPGAEVAMWVVSVRGEADVWTFTVLGTEPLARSVGPPQPALVLRRGPRRPWDTEVRVWLDPTARHLPLRAIWRTEAEGSTVELERDSLAWQ